MNGRRKIVLVKRTTKVITIGSIHFVSKWSLILGYLYQCSIFLINLNEMDHIETKSKILSKSPSKTIYAFHFLLLFSNVVFPPKHSNKLLRFACKLSLEEKYLLFFFKVTTLKYS